VAGPAGHWPRVRPAKVGSGPTSGQKHALFSSMGTGELHRAWNQGRTPVSLSPTEQFAGLGIL
jgi:hypothetical protein